MSFPLYYTLNSNLQASDLKKAEKEEIMKSIQTMDISSQEALFLLIYEHNKINSNQQSDVYEIPYDGVYTNEDEIIEFNLAKFPIQLRRIIYKFTKIIQQN